MKLRLCVLLTVVFALSWSSYSADDDDDDKPKVKLVPVVLSAKALEAADLGVQSLGPGIIDRRMDVPGEIVLNSDNLAHLSSKIPGVVLQVTKTIGAQVKAGEILAVIESSELGNAKIEFHTARLNVEFAKTDLERERTLRNDTLKLLEALKMNPAPADAEKQTASLRVGDIKTKLLSAYSALALAQTSWDRAQSLIGDVLISKTAYESAKKEYEAAKAEYAGDIEEVSLASETRLLQAERSVQVATNTHTNAMRRLRILGLNENQIAALPQEKEDHINRFELKAPFAGTILERNIGLGERIDDTKPAFVLADLSNVWLNLRVFAKDLAQVQISQAVRVNAPGFQKSLSCEIAYISPILDNRTRTAQARAVLDNASGNLRPGSFVTGTIVLERSTLPIVVPNDAVQTLGGQNVLFVCGDKDGEFIPKPVSIGASDGSRVEIKSGVEAGKRAVLKNAFLLKAELGKGASDDD